VTTPVNNPYSPTPLLQPRIRIIASPATGPAIVVPGAMSCSITNTNNFHGDRYSASFAVSLSGDGSFAWWESQSDLEAEVQIGLVPPGQPESSVVWTPYIQGPVDRIACNFTGASVQIDGRDYTAKLIDWKTQLANVNQTSSEIVEAICEQVGVMCQATKTTTPVGRYYQIEHDRISLNQFHRSITGWDEIVMLARWEGFDAFFIGETLHFQPTVDLTSDPYLLWWQEDENGRITSNMVSFSGDRALTVAKGVQVIVKSWHGKQGKGFTSGYPNKNPTSAANAKVQQYVFIRPNLTQDQALQLAQRLYTEIIRNERTISVGLPGDNILTVQVPIKVTGTGTGFDQAYYVDTITRTVDDQGYRMTLTAKNHSPQTETTVAS
jgi:hypothetical protein